MATATSRRAKPDADALKARRALAQKRLKIEQKLQGDYARIADYDAALKQIATDAGESFKEQFGKDYVSASGAVAAEFKGNVPVIQSEVYLALTAREQREIDKSYPGLIKIEPHWGKASNGRVTVKVY
jgi:hypothetical protein